MWLRSWLERTPQRRVGVLTRLLGHDLAPQAAGPRLDRAVAAHVDPRPQPALAAQLEAVGDLLDGLEGPEAQLDGLAAGARERARSLLDQCERRVERSGVEPLDAWPAADDDSVCHGRVPQRATASRSAAVSAPAGTGSPKWRPCASRQPCAARNSACTRVSTPSATVSIPSASDSAITASTIAPAPGSSGMSRM